jgi:hypothetical protein
VKPYAAPMSADSCEAPSRAFFACPGGFGVCRFCLAADKIGVFPCDLE